jgi:Raf kinase inhibitor-like YbhB/YbcL family protein
MKITSPAFRHNERIPRTYTCQGEDKNPPLEVRDIPGGTQSIALIMDDPDAPSRTWDHWIVFNIPVRDAVTKVAENSVPGTQGWNSFGRIAYGGPCPPSGTHRYFFKVYALDIQLSLREGARKLEVERAMQGHILEQSELIGLYKKSSP